MAEGFVEVPGGRVWYAVAGAGRARGPAALPPRRPGNPPRLPGAPGRPRRRAAGDLLRPAGCGRSPGPDGHGAVDRGPGGRRAGRGPRRAGRWPRMHLFGNSWGGWLALEYISRPEPPRSLIISSTPASVALDRRRSPAPGHSRLASRRPRLPRGRATSPAPSTVAVDRVLPAAPLPALALARLRGAGLPAWAPMSTRPCGGPASSGRSPGAARLRCPRPARPDRGPRPGHGRALRRGPAAHGGRGREHTRRRAGHLREQLAPGLRRGARRVRRAGSRLPAEAGRRHAPASA